MTVTRRIEESVLHMMTVTHGEAHIGAYYASCEPMKRKLNKGCTYQDKWTITFCPLGLSVASETM